MAIHKSAIKRNRQALRRRERNRAVMSELKTLAKKALTAVEDSNLDEAKKVLQSAASAFGRAVAKGIIHKNNAARKISRLTLKVKGLAKGLGAAPAEGEAAAKKAAKAKSKKKAAPKKAAVRKKKA